MTSQIEHNLFINSIENFYQLFKFNFVKKIYFYILLLLFITNKSLACQLLNVPIGSNVNSAVTIFEFLEGHNKDVYGDEFSAKYEDYALDYCEGSSLENSDLEVIVYNSKIAGINLINSHNENKNEIYEFVKNFISDPGSEAKNKSWTGYKNLSIGDLIITYGKTEISNEIIEYLEITNAEMFDFTLGERVMNATG